MHLTTNTDFPYNENTVFSVRYKPNVHIRCR